MKNNKSFIINVLIFAVIVLIIAISSDTVISSDKINSIESYQNVFIDSSRSLDIKNIIKDKNNLAFQNYHDSNVSSVIDDANYWIHIPLENLPIASGNNLLELSKPHLSKVVFYQISSSGEIVKQAETGRNASFSSRDINYRQFLFEIDKAYSDGDIYIMINTESYLQAPTKLWSYNEFISVSNERSLILGIFYGSLIIMVLYNGFLAYSLRDIRYVFYVLFVLSFGILQTVWDGYSLQYIWPGFYKWDTISNAILIGFCGVWLMAFNFSFFEIKTRGKKITALYKIFFIFSIASLLSMNFLSMKLAINLASSIGMISLIASILSFVKSIPKNKSHYIYITAWSVFFYMAVISSLGGFKIIPYSILAVHGMKIGILILVILFSLALSYKIKEIEYMRIVEVEKGMLLRKLHKVNRKITSTRDLNLLYLNMLDGYKSFLSFDQMIVGVEEDNQTFSLNLTSEISNIMFNERTYTEYKSFDISSISIPSTEFLSALSHDSVINSIVIPLESRTYRQGFVLFTFKSNYEISDQIKNLLVDYTYQISLAIENIILLQELKLAAERDSLTKLYNRNFFFEKSNEIINTINDNVISIAMIDIDHFKLVNDTYGHTIGDKALVHISRQMLEHFPISSIIARYGGEEFVIIINTKNKNEAFQLLDSFRLKIEHSPITIGVTEPINITISAGIASYTDGITVDGLVEKADHLLYEVKKAGRNKVFMD